MTPILTSHLQRGHRCVRLPAQTHLTGEGRAVVRSMHAVLLEGGGGGVVWPRELGSTDRGRQGFVHARAAQLLSF